MTTESVYTKDILAENILNYGFEIGDYTIGAPLIRWWGEHARLKIGRFCSIGNGVEIFLGGNHRTDWVTTYPFSGHIVNQNWPEAQRVAGHPATKGDVVIGNDVWLGNESVILSGVSIGDGAVVGARAVVSKNVPPYTIVVGNPAREVRKRFSDECIEKLLSLQWWNWEEEKIRKSIPLLLSGNIEEFCDMAFALSCSNAAQMLDLQKSLGYAEELYLKKRFREAVDTCKEILHAFPDQPNAIQLLGCIAFEQDSLDEAQELMQRSLELAPDNSVFLCNLGAVQEKLGLFQEALASCNRVLELNPEDADAYHYQGKAYAKMGNNAKAIVLQQKALSLRPDFRAAYVALAAAKMPGDDYLALLTRFHQWLQPSYYVEIGVETGQSLKLVASPTIAVGVDPEPRICHQFSAETHVYPMTSDSFFQTNKLPQLLKGNNVEMAFIDGLHLFEQALKDFINLECYATKKSIVLIHDCLPLDKNSSARNRCTEFWSGDPWKVIACLKAYRPDLSIMTIPAHPTGLGLVTNLNPESTVLSDNFERIVSEYVNLDFDDIEDDLDIQLNVVENNWGELQDTLEAIKREQ